MDLSRCFLHTLGEVEARKLAELRSRLPGLMAEARSKSEKARALQKISFWGVDLDVQSEASDMVLLKFVRREAGHASRAEDIDIDRAAERLLATIVFRADRILSLPEPTGCFAGHDFVDGNDPLGRPLMISRFGAMDLEKVFGNTEAFVDYRLKVMEQAMSRINWMKGQPEDLCQVHDYSGVPLIFQTSEVKNSVAAVTQALTQHYPETKGKTVFVNFPAVFATLFKAFSIFIPEKSRQKFVILGEGDHAALFGHVRPEQVPEGLGGLKRPSRLAHLPGKLVQVGARAEEEAVVVEAHCACSLFWELRACEGDISYEVAFQTHSGSEQLLAGPTALLSSAGVVSGECKVQEAGILMCRFSNTNAWFQSRLCACRGMAA